MSDDIEKKIRYWLARITFQLWSKGEDDSVLANLVCTRKDNLRSLLKMSEPTLIHTTFAKSELWLMDQLDAADYTIRRMHGITARLCVSEDKPEFHGDLIWQHHEPIDDDVKGDAPLAKLADMIDENLNAGRSIVVHCRDGRNRGAAVILYWMIRFYNRQGGRKRITFDAAYKALRIARPCVSVHWRLQEQIKKELNC
jgi:hypothetical protein